mmetsp:Transcript_178/g.214  ORF Transcript_178/g.214 Transcript_178/m.214 type:complete len:260 (+) Transcript_178:147-926(+)
MIFWFRLEHRISCSDQMFRHSNTLSWRKNLRYFSRLTKNCNTNFPAAHHLNTTNAPYDFDLSSTAVYENFLSVVEADSLVHDIKTKMKRRRYDKGHWDAVITNFKEVEVAIEDELGELSQSTIDRTRAHLLENYLDGTATFLPIHFIDYKKEALLKPHVDSVRFSGGLVAGISLESSAIMRLKPSAELGRDPEEGYVDLLLTPLSLYVLTGVCRYQYTHELLPSGSIFEPDDGASIVVDRKERLSVIFRDAKDEQLSVE